MTDSSNQPVGNASRNGNRLDRLEALAETTLLAIRELSHRQDRTQQQLDQLRGEVSELKARFEDVAHQQELNAEQIAANTAGMVELRNVLADFIRSQGQR